MPISKRSAKLSALLVVALLTVPFVAKADTVDVTLTGVNGNVDAGIYTSPYYATVNGETNVAVVCDDFAHQDSIGESWTATESTLSNLSDVRFDQGSPNQFQAYEEEAWLFDQLMLNPSQTGSISFAMWALFTPSAESSAGFTTSGPDSSAAWLSAAENQTFTPGEFSNIVILTPTDPGPGSPQEYMIATALPTPEPSSLLLLGAGMLGVALFLRWRMAGEAGADGSQD